MTGREPAGSEWLGELSDGALGSVERPAAGTVAAGPRYRLGGELGVGAMGRVRAAYDTLLEREVALKQVRAAGDAAAEAALLREARVTAGLDHPAIIAVLDAGDADDGQRFYAMRVVHGRSLAEVVEPALDAAARTSLVRAVLQVAQAIAYAHTRGVVHRDLSPRNVRLGTHGEVVVHLDWHADAYARLILDELFGAENFLNEIIWTYHGPSPIRTAFNRKHDTILSYVKGKNYTFNADAVREPYNQNTVNTFKSSSKAGFGKVPNLERGKVPEDWWYFPVVARLHNERTGYPTQKPNALVERIILASSNPGDLVADFFCGSGTTPYVAAKNGRKFIACDENPSAIHTARCRLLDVNSVFSIEHDTSFNVPFSTLPKSTRVENGNEIIRLDTKLDLDYWEVDLSGGEKMFRSVAQAKRPVRSGDIPLELKIKNGGKVCIRFVTVKGKQYQLNI
jgi:serine/threonine protein kinase